MVEVKVYSDIANKKEGVFMSMMGMDNNVFSADTVRNIFDKNADEKEFKFNIHCDGGNVAEGLAIYDIIRNSGKTIYTNIEGACHSMAVTLLLSAPKENRTANLNCRALIHQVYATTYDSLNADELHTLAEQVRQEQDAILDIYAERTGHDRAELENLMKEEKQRTAQELLKYGFINKINTYSTNQKNQTMTKKRQEVVNAADNFLSKLKNMFKAETYNYDFTDEEGNLLFSTDSEDETLEKGMSASPDGEFTLPDGHVVTIEDGKITEILKPVNETEVSEEEIEEMRNKISDLEAKLQNSITIITDLRNQVTSNYKPVNRINNPGKKENKQLTSAEKKNEAKEKMNKAKGGK